MHQIIVQLQLNNNIGKKVIEVVVFSLECDLKIGFHKRNGYVSYLVVKTIDYLNNICPYLLPITFVNKISQFKILSALLLFTLTNWS